MSAKVSIIVPCYGVEKYLDRCMETLVNQTLQDIEIILVDDVSPDRVPQMCDEWAKKDSRVKVIHKQKNEGLGYARNSGLDVVTGEYVAFVDSDDFVKLNMYETLFNKAKSEDADAVFCNCILYKGPDRQVVRCDVTQETAFRGRKAVDGFLLDIIGTKPDYPKSVKYMASVWHGVYKCSLIKSNGIRFVSERQFISEDVVFDIDFLHLCEKIIYIPDALYLYSYNTSSLSHTIDDRKYYRIQQFIKDIDCRLNELFDKSEYFVHLQRYCLFQYFQSVKNSYLQRYNTIKIEHVVNDSFWKDYLCDYPIYKLPFRYKIMMIICSKRHLWPLFAFIFKR